MYLDVFNIKGEKVGQIVVRDDVFNVPFNMATVHQAAVRQLANRRQGTADSKTRGEISKSTRKLFAQKHTGRARAGSVKSPLRRGGGVVFGPHPRSYRQAMPRKMRRLALRCVLSDKARAGELKVVESLGLDRPRAKGLFDILLALEIGTSVIIVDAETDYNVIKSAKNLPGVETLPVRLLNVADLLSCRALIMTTEAVRVAEDLWGQKPVQEVAASLP